MSGVNKVILIGNLGKDPEVFKFDNGGKKVTFTVATNEVFKDKDGQKTEKVEWHTVVAYRGIADVVEQYLKKGQLVYVEGSLHYRQWEDPDGKKHYFTEIECDVMNMLGGRRDDE